MPPTTDVQAAASAVAAPAESSTATLDPTAVLESLNGEQLAEYEATGKLPEIPPPTEESDPSGSEEEQSGAAEEADKSAAASEAAKKQELPRRDKAEDRKKELAADVEKLLKDRAEIRAENERLLKQRDAKPAESSTAKPATPEAKPKPTPGEKNPDGSPKFKSYEEYLDARDTWVKESFAAEVKAAEQKAATEKRAKDTADSWQKQVTEVTKKYPDYADVAKTLQLPEGTKRELISGVLLRSALGAEMVYHLATHPDEAKAITAIDDPYDQARELYKLEFKLAGTLKDPIKDKAPTRITTKAPEPPAEVAARATAPEDEEKAALQAGDYSRFERIRNAKERKSS